MARTRSGRVRRTSRVDTTRVPLHVCADGMLDLRSNIGRLFLSQVSVLTGVLWTPIRTRSTSGDVEEVSERHQRDIRRLRLLEIPRQRQPFIPDGHHLNANEPRGAQARSRPEAAHHNVAAVGAQHRGLDGAEHRAILSHVMAGNERAIHCASHALSGTDPRYIQRPLGRMNTGSRHQGVSDPKVASKGEAETTTGVAHALVSVDAVPNAPPYGRHRTPPDRRQV